MIPSKWSHIRNIKRAANSTKEGYAALNKLVEDARFSSGYDRWFWMKLRWYCLALSRLGGMLERLIEREEKGRFKR